MRILRMLFSFEGTINRNEYWFFWFLLFLVLFLGSIFYNANPDGFLIVPIALILVAILIALFYSLFPVQAKRCDDIGIPRYFLLLTFIPYVNWVWWILIGLLPSRNDSKKSYDKFYENMYDEFEECKNRKIADSANNGQYLNKNKRNFIDEKIIQCPVCQTRIGIDLSSMNNSLTCNACQTRFNLYIDENGFIYITKNDKRTDNSFMSIEDCFKILDLNYGADSRHIKEAYRKKMMAYHPDRVQNLGEKLQQIAEEESKKINKAYMLLKEYNFL